MISPPNAGVASAIGMVASPNSFELVKADMQLLENLNFVKLEKNFFNLKKEGEKSLLKTGANKSEIFINNSLLMRYVGQGYEVEVPLKEKYLNLQKTEKIKGEFEKVYKNLFGRIENMPLEIISLRTIASDKSSISNLRHISTKLSSITKQKKRKVYFGGKDFHETKVFNRINLPKLFKEDGPLIIEERESTLVIPPNFNVKLDLNGNLIVTRVNKNV